MGYVGPLGKSLNFLSPLGSLNSYDFLSFLFILKLFYSKPFHNTLNYASTANIEEVMKFYNLGHKTFETDFSLKYFRNRTYSCTLTALHINFKSNTYKLYPRYLLADVLKRPKWRDKRPCMSLGSPRWKMVCFLALFSFG